MATPYTDDYLNDGRVLIAQLRELGVLVEAESERLTECNGGVVITCLDANQFDDLYSFHASLSPSRRLAPITSPGGCLCIPCTSPLANAKVGDQVVSRRLSTFADVSLCINELGIRSAYLYGHFPCKAAFLNGLGVREQLELMVRAKRDLKAEFSTSEQPFVVALMFHAAQPLPGGGFDKRRTYHVPRERALSWLAETAGSSR